MSEPFIDFKNKGEEDAIPITAETLNNMQILIADAIEKLNKNSIDARIYSVQETAIGTWKNGKTIYRKVVVGSFKSEAVIATGVDTLIHTSGSGDVGTGVMRSIPYFETFNGKAYALGAELVGTNIRVKAVMDGDNVSTSNNTNIIIEYTKVAD